ncbi:MAG TPA: flagellar basal body protein FliL, partial [Alphaproteobacteria bacterium]|nr:flagellar basal body protein FliL [Alphaproteobacteria bacterium]
MSEEEADKEEAGVLGESGDVEPIEEGGSKNKMILMIAIPIVLLLAGGAGLYFTGTLDKLL